jgi:hypothetical protein
MTARPKTASRKQKAIGFAFCFLLFTCGLAGCQNCHQVERELRDREREVRELREELDGNRAMTMALQQELCDIRQGRTFPSGAPLPPPTPIREAPPPEPLPPPTSSPGVTQSSKPTLWHGPPTVPPRPAEGPPTAMPFEATLPANTVKEIVLGRQAGGYDQSCGHGDDALQVALEPHDQDGSTIKVPGYLHVDLLEILPGGTKRPLSSWDVPPNELRHSWKNGFFGSGYFVVLPWKCWPTTDKLRVVAQFTLPDGRLFEADKDVTLHLPPVACRKPLPPPDPVPEGPTLPLPHRAEKLVPPAVWPPNPLQGAVRLLRPE